MARKPKPPPSIGFNFGPLEPIARPSLPVLPSTSPPPETVLPADLDAFPDYEAKHEEHADPPPPEPIGIAIARDGESFIVSRVHGPHAFVRVLYTREELAEFVRLAKDALEIS